MGRGKKKDRWTLKLSSTVFSSLTLHPYERIVVFHPI